MRKNAFAGTVLAFAGLILAACGGEAVEHGRKEVAENADDVYMYCFKDDEHCAFASTITMRIHEDMPEFTFHLIVGELVPEYLWHEHVIPNPREVSIIIEDESGNIVQEIFNLIVTDVWSGGWTIEIEFEDFNFDGYLDMRLFRYRHDVGALFAEEYFWLWDVEQSQFILNEQLMWAAQVGLHANPKTQQIETWLRMTRGGSYRGFYEWHDNVLVQVKHQVSEFFWHGEDGPWYWKFSETDGLTGETITIITPTDIYSIPLEHISTTTIRINEDMPEFTFHRFVGEPSAQMQYEIPDPREVGIVIVDEHGAIIQIITGLTQSDWFNLERVDIEFVDLNFDGYLDMRLFRWQVGAGGLLAHEYFWLWDVEQAQFVLNEQMMDIYFSFLDVNAQTQQLEIFMRLWAAGRYYAFYEWHNDELVLVTYIFENHVWHGEDGPWYWEWVETNALTGETTTIITPTDSFGNPID